MYAQTTATTQSRHIVTRVAKAGSRSRRICFGLLASMRFVALLSLASSGAALAATAPNLGSTSTFGVVSSTFTNANTGLQTIINGDVCYTTGPTTPPVTITGTTVVACPPAVGQDQGLALANLNAQANAPTCTVLSATPLEAVIIGANPAGTFPPGCYTSAGAMNISANGIVTLSGVGVYVFRPGGALNTAANSVVSLINGACASDVFWAPVGAASLGANAAASSTATFSGNILDAAGINLGHFANMTGRALAFGGTVNTDAATITVPTCAPFVGAPGSITINKVAQGGNSTFNFSSTVPGNASFPIATINGSGSNVISGVGAGLYTVTEAVPAGWNLSALTCTDPTSDSTVNVGTATATINLASGESVSCTFTDNLLLLLPSSTGVPTLAEWALIMLALLLLLTGWLQYRRRQ